VKRNRNSGRVPLFVVEPLEHFYGVTRGLDHASRIYPTCVFEVPKSGEPDFGAIHLFCAIAFRSSVDSYSKEMDARVKPAHDNFMHLSAPAAGSD
jgi:hypothetical protein